jgi:hypothetical protein
MSSLTPPRGYKRGFTDTTCHEMAERALMSPMGQAALRQGWGRGLYRYVMAWGSTPQKPETKAALHRAANDVLWELGDLRKIEKPDQMTRALISLYEKALAREQELREIFLRD